MTGSAQGKAANSIFAGGGEMGELMRAGMDPQSGSLDWSKTPLGAVENWSQSLRSTLSICLNSRFPIAIYWGQDCLLLYNDAWRPIVGDKHPWALGRPAREVWSEIWDDIGPELASVLATGEGTFHKDDLLAMHRFGYTEECFFEYTFNPIQTEAGVIGGVFNVVSETTYRVLNDRRARLLRELASRTGTAKTVEEACALMVETLKSDPADIPFALLYLINSNSKSAHLCSSTESDTSFASDNPIRPAVVDLTLADSDAWSIASVAQTAQAQTINDLPTRFGTIPGSPWAEPPEEAMVLPIAIPGQGKVIAVLVAVASPRRRLDDQYRDFFDQVARQIELAIANARTYEEERKRAETLAELDRAKTLFFSNVSHEFRTPLTLMLSPLEELSTSLDKQLQPDQREQLQLIQRNGLRLQKLVNTLLDFSRIEAGRVQASYEPTDLASYTAELSSVFRSLIERAGLRLVIDCPPLPELVYIDRDMWEKIVLNLMSNAFKFTFTGSITVRLQTAGDLVELRVTDTGVGIPEAELPRLFERFHRVNAAKSRTYEGSGIGLALVQELVKLHSGTIDVTSQIDQGTTFTIAIPFGTAHLPPDRIQSPQTLSVSAITPWENSDAIGVMSFVEEAARWLSEESAGFPVLSAELSPGALIQTSTVKPQNVQAARILLADDNADMRDYVKRLLSQRYVVEAVADGMAALDAIHHAPPNLVLTDVMMPGLDGFGLLKALRSDPKTQQIPIILLSARAGEEARVEGLEAGADDYLIKPFSARELLARVEAALKLAQLRQEAQEREYALRTEAEAVRVRLESILTDINDQFIVLDRHWRYTFVNQQVMTVTGKRQEELLGHCIWEVFPDVANTPFDQAVRRAIAEDSFVQFELFYPPLQRWFENRIYPFAEGVTIFVTDISDRKQTEAALQAATAEAQQRAQEAEAANRIKDEFLAVLSHELRSPLNPILGWSRLLQNSKLDEVKTKHALATIERNAKLQAELIEDLLDVSRILQGKLKLNVAPVNLAQTIYAAIEIVRLATEAKSIQIETDLDADVGLVTGDSTRLQQVVWNLLSNAVKFTPTGGQVKVKLSSVSGRSSLVSTIEQTTNDQRLMTNYAQITVSDNGKGITSDFLPYVFDYFRQADSATTRQFGGLGLGLAISRHLVELHGGTIQANSPGAGLGAVFTVQLPLLPTQATSDLVAPLTPSLDLKGIQALVVDDETDSRDLIAFLLEQVGVSVTTAASAGEAFQALTQSRFDVLLSDIGMPDIDGYMLIQQIRTLPAEQGGQIPAIALTAYAGEMNQQQAIAAGFQQHIPKPVDLERLVNAIFTLCNRSPDSNTNS